MERYPDTHPYHLLIWPKSKNECFTRIDRYSIIRYWYERLDGKDKAYRETLFYPSECGIEEIKEYQNQDKSALNDRALTLIKRLEQLEKFGNGVYGTVLNELIQPGESIIEIRTKKLSRKAVKLNRKK